MAERVIVQRGAWRGLPYGIRTSALEEAVDNVEKDCNGFWIFRDRAGNVVVRTSFDAFGKRRDDDWSGAPSAAELTAVGNSTRRGYTGHEYLDNIDLTHMNGRVYDPTVGRFLSADPIVQAPYFGQSHNRYSYVFNNPLAFTDPSGFTGDCGDCYMTPAWDPAPRIWLWINMVHAAHTRAVMMVMVREFMREQTNIANATQMGPVVRTRQPDLIDDSLILNYMPMQGDRPGLLWGDDDESSDPEIRTYLGCRSTAIIFYHCYTVIARGKEIHRQYSLKRPDGKFMPQTSTHDTFRADRRAFLEGRGQIFEIDPPDGTSQADFASTVEQHAENYRLGSVFGNNGPVYWYIFSNSNSAASFPILMSGGRLPRRALVDRPAPGLWDYEAMIRSARTPVIEVPIRE